MIQPVGFQLENSSTLAALHRNNQYLK
ncbi:hypothetical protein Nmel_014398 [Mimus melanotis]